MRWLIVPTMLLVAVPLQKNCGTVKVDGPKTAECPEGRYIVTADQTQDPPVVSYRCEKPAPSPSPTSSASPVPSPAASPSSSPIPRPSTTASPTPPPVPSSPPSAAPGSPIPVQLHVCPANYPRKPEHVKVGKNARRAPANPFAWLINLSPLVSEAAGLCQDENGHSRAGSDGMCEQWGACATQGLHDDANPLSSWEPGVYAEGPGFSWDHVESRSRPADPAEPPCPSDNRACYINYYLKNLVLGDGGSGPGHYFLCAAVTEAEVKDRNHIAPTAECADFELTLP